MNSLAAIPTQWLPILCQLLAAVLAGALIGIERSFHGRPAGFRTHTLVCTASALLMLVTLYQSEWLPRELWETMQTDPTRMAQGIMTGIGFLGAGVIYKENFGVTGLTTAASIWITAAIGILLGVGFYFPAACAVVMTVIVLSLFRHIESRMPSLSYAHFLVRFDRHDCLNEPELRRLLTEHQFKIANMSYRVVENGQYYEYRAVIHTMHARRMSTLAENLRVHPLVRELKISPTGD